MAILQKEDQMKNQLKLTSIDGILTNIKQQDDETKQDRLDEFFDDENNEPIYSESSTSG